ncbi:MAG: hypothetical protein RL404_851 [Pseudomonadota bacterium]|jgi:hypothetical protein
MNTHRDNDFPVLTDVISDRAPYQQPADAENVHVTHVEVAHEFHDEPAPPLALNEIHDTLSERLVAELSLQVPVLVEAALRELLPQAMGARLQAEILTALTNALPLAAQAAAGELSAKVAYEVGGLLEQRLQDEVRRAVADELARLTGTAA